MFTIAQYPALDEGVIQTAKKDKIGHLGLLAESCLKYSIEFNLLIESGHNSYSSAFSDNLKKAQYKKRDQIKKVIIYMLVTIVESVSISLPLI